MSNIDFTIYTYGGGEQLSLAFNAIAVLFKAKIYLYSFYISAVLFGFWVLVNSIIKNEALVPFKWMFWFWLATTLMLSPKTNVLIKDPITKVERKVDNVPYILGSFAGIISTMGYSLTATVETFFKLPDYDGYGDNGSMFASKILKNMDKYRIRDGVLKENMARFIDQCVVLESMMGGVYTVGDLHKTDNIWELVRDNANPINGFSYRDETKKETKIVTCKAGAIKLDADLTKHTKSLASYFGKKFNLIAYKTNPTTNTIDTYTTPDAVFESFFKQKLKNSYEFMSGIANQAEDILKQEMMINAIDDTKQSYAVAKATIQQRQWHLVTGDLASNFLVGLKIVLETLAYSGFIFIAILVMLPTGITILGRYLQILLWLQLWAPLYAILNMVMSSVARHQTKNVLAGEGLNILTSIGLSGLHADIEAIAAMCSASIPFISYSILQGGVGSFMHLAGNITGAMSGAAQSASSEVTSGNMAMNSVSYGNRSQMNTGGFKHDTSLSYKAGKMDMERLDGAQNFLSASGSLGVVAGAGFNTSKLPDNMSISRAINSGLSSAINQERSIAANHSKGFEQHKSMALNHSADLLSSMSRNMGQNRGWQVANNSRYSDSINATTNFTKQLQESEGYTEKQAAEIAASIGLGVPLSLSGVKTSFSSAAARDAAVQKGRSLAESQNLTKSLEEGVSHLDEVKYNESMGEEKKLAEGLRTELSEAERSLHQYNLHTAIADKWQETKNMSENLGIGITEDASEKLINFIAETRGLQGEKLGRAKAIEIATTRTGEYGHLLQKFAESEAAKLLNNSQGSSFIQQATAAQQQQYQGIKHREEESFSKDVAKNENNKYGQFNQEQEKIAIGDKSGKDDKGNYESTVYNKAVEDRIKGNDITMKNDLKTHGDLNSDDAKTTYQEYKPLGSDKKQNIVQNVRQAQDQTKEQINKQEQDLTAETSSISADFKESQDRTLIGKATGIKVIHLDRNHINKSDSGRADEAKQFSGAADTNTSDDENKRFSNLGRDSSASSPKTFTEERNENKNQTPTSDHIQANNAPLQKAWIEQELDKEKPKVIKRQQEELNLNNKIEKEAKVIKKLNESN